MKHPILALMLGTLMVLAGVLNLTHPFPATLTVQMFSARSFIIIGALQAVSAFIDAESWARLWLGLLGLVMIWFGVLILYTPMNGRVTLTVLFALSYIASGLAKFFVGWKLGSFGPGIWIMVSGAVSLVLGIVISVQSPYFFLVLFPSIELLANGLALLALSKANKSE